MSTAVFVYIWEYIVVPEFRDEFKTHYGPDGSWVKLFSKAKGYITTTLNEDISNPNRFTTIDVWKCKEDHDNFLNLFHTEYIALDKACEMFTTQEKLIGYFDQYDH